jgi:multicomponent K+:H+ antiporter subunit A
VVSIVLLLLALYFLPRSPPEQASQWRVARDLALAGLAGLGAGLLVWGVMTRPYETIAGYFLEQSVPGGGGTNVVNVILVDFRGFDTLGEITVLAVAAVGIRVLLDGLRLPLPAADPAGRAWDDDPHPLILSVLSRLLLPMALLVSVFLLLRGHNLPGGGFIAGLVTAVALILQYMASGVAWTRSRLRFDPATLLASGVLLAALTGLGSWAFGRPFLTSAHGHPALALLGEVPLASAMVFDLGVYLTVVGATLLILASLGKLTVGVRRDADGA